MPHLGHQLVLQPAQILALVHHHGHQVEPEVLILEHPHGHQVLPQPEVVLHHGLPVLVQLILEVVLHHGLPVLGQLILDLGHLLGHQVVLLLAEQLLLSPMLTDLILVVTVVLAAMTSMNVLHVQLDPNMVPHVPAVTLLLSV